MASAKLLNTPITELSNETTSDIDLTDATGIVRLLRQCDAQIFCGWRSFPCLYDGEVLRSLGELSEAVQQVLRDPDGSCVVFSGCGTSGRFGFALAKKFNALAKDQNLHPCPYHYLIAGGDLALFASVEIPEDDYRQGQIDLMDSVKGKKHVLFIGISCGLSAPYIAGQLDYCMDNPDIFTPVLLGFNPVELARNTPIERWSKTFLDVVKRLSKPPTSMILNPVVGPEAITGSSRMKSGSATKILLESALLKAHFELQPRAAVVSFPSVLSCYEMVFRSTYLLIDEISMAISLAAKSLKQKGRIYYLSWGPSSFMPLLDASECVPTFSASYDDVRAFVDKGFKFLQNKEGPVEFHQSKLQISLEEFTLNFLPSLSARDTVMLIYSSPQYLDDVYEVAKQVSQKGASLVGISTQSGIDFKIGQECEQLLDVLVQTQGLDCQSIANPFSGSQPNVQMLFKQCLDEITVKLVLNAVSTGAHALCGKVLKGCMIDVKVSNNKLFRRAVGIVSRFGRVAENEALVALLKSIYRTDALHQSAVSDVISRHVRVASIKDQVVPLAVLLATGKFDVELGLKVLEEKTVSKILQELDLLEN